MKFENAVYEANFSMKKYILTLPVGEMLHGETMVTGCD